MRYSTWRLARVVLRSRLSNALLTTKVLLEGLHRAEAKEKVV